MTMAVALLMQSQLIAWRSNGVGAYKPNLWIAANRAFNEFYCWPHQDFLSSLDGSKATGNTLSLRPPSGKLEFGSISELVLHVLRVA